MKISIIGASGAVGSELVRNLLENSIAGISELVLFYHSDIGKKRLMGLAYDICVGNRVLIIKITNAQDELTNSDIVIMCGGIAVSMNIRSIPKSGNKNGNNRDLLYSTNREIVLEWANVIKKYAPHCLLVLVTNPVSKLLKDIYNYFPEIVAVGCGVTNDTLRVRNELQKRNPLIHPEACFVIGEHDLEFQTITLRNLNQSTGMEFDRSDFEYVFTSESLKKSFISQMKNKQNCAIRNNEITMNMNDDLPYIYQSYLNHRLAHFLYKTHISTALAIRKILDAYNEEREIVSVETAITDYCGLGGCVLGVPIQFKDKRITFPHIELDDYEISILKACSYKYELG